MAVVRDISARDAYSSQLIDYRPFSPAHSEYGALSCAQDTAGIQPTAQSTSKDRPPRDFEGEIALEQIVEFLIELIPLFGLALATISRWWHSRGTTVIAVPEEERGRLGKTKSVSLSPDLVRRLEEGAETTVVTVVEQEPGHETKLAPARAKRARLTRSSVTYGLVVFFSVTGFAWSIITLSTHSSTEAKYGATATLGWVFGYWFRPEVLTGHSS